MGNSNGLRIDLEVKLDKYEQPYFVGRQQYPGTISFKKGLAILIFTSEEENENLQISTAKPNSRVSSVRKTVKDDGSVDRVYIRLKKVFDRFKNPYYVAVVQDDLDIDLTDGYNFMVFTSNEGSEELQLTRNFKYAKSDRKTDHSFNGSKFDEDFESEEEEFEYDETVDNKEQVEYNLTNV